MLDLADVIGKRIVTTRLMQNVTVREENAMAALEVMSRFAANPKWLIYLPPTMSPPETTRESGLLEHPREAFAYFRNQGIARVVCEEKHMGSRAVVIVCRDEGSARRRFGVDGDGAGIIYTRTGRRFFEDRAMEAALLDHLRRACTEAGYWDEFASDWFCFDCELMPWSAKAQDLIKHQYAAVGSAAKEALRATITALQETAGRFPDQPENPIHAMVQQYADRTDRAEKYVNAYRQYCWPVNGVNDLKLAPFHLLANEGKTYADQDHVWHMRTLSRLALAQDAESPLMATRYEIVDLTDPASEAAATQWWTDLTAQGGEGMVVKPIDFIVRGNKGLVQPAVKCRGKEYPHHLRPRVRRRGKPHPPAQPRRA